MQRFFPLIACTLFLSACPQKAPPPPTRTAPEAVSMPTVDQAFIRAALHPEASLANKPLLADLDHRPGTEALVVIHRQRQNHELALLRGNHKILARSPLGGKFLAHATLRHVGEMKIVKLLEDDGKVLFLPIETSIKRQYVCGVLLFRYRGEMLVQSGELGCRCWRKEAGAAKTEDPHALFKAEAKPAGASVEVQEVRGTRIYVWDKEMASFSEKEFVPKEK